MSYNNMQPSTTAILGFAGTGVVLNGVLAAHRLCKLIKGQGESVEAMNKPTSEGGVDGCCRDNVYGMTVAARDEACSLAGCAALTLYAAHMCGRTRSVTDPVATALLALSSAQIASHFVEHPIAEKARPVLQVAQLGILGYCIGQLLDWF